MSELSDSAILLSMDRIRGMAIEGLNYANNTYDRERYTALLEIVSEMYGNYLHVPHDSLLARFTKELGSCTPKIGVNVAVRTASGRLLALRRSDDKRWCLPCGWVAIGESPEDAAVRETFEETGLQIYTQGTIDLLTKGPTENAFLHHQLNLLILSEPIEEKPIILSGEHHEYDWISDPRGLVWHPGHLEHVECALAFIKNPSCAILKVKNLNSQNADSLFDPRHA